MSAVKSEKVVNAALSEVWKTWDAYGDVYKFHPGVEKSYLLEDSVQAGKGARRRCDFVGGKNYVLEEIVSYNPEASFTHKLYDGNIPVKHAFVTFTFQPLGTDRTKVLISAEFKMKFGLLGALLKPIMRKQLQKGLDAMLDGNADYLAKQIRFAA